MRANSFLTLVIAIVTLISCKDKQGPMVMPPPAIPVVEVINKDVLGYAEYPVNIEGKVNNAVRPKISGYIKEVYVDEGQRVSAGQPLFRLETNVQTQDANAAQANITAAQAGVNAAQVEVDRLTPLVERNVISNVQLETAKANLSRAKSQLAQAKAGLGSIQASMDFAIVRSPVSGVVGTINYREGSLVSPSDPTPITSVSETSEVYAYFSMNEAEYLDFLEDFEGKTIKDKLSHLPEVELILANGKPYNQKGKINTVTGQIDPKTGTIQFRATFKNTEGLLTNGNSGFVHIPQQFSNVLVIPENATYEQQGIVYVYKVSNDTVKTVPVVISNRINNIAILKSGLEKGDVIAAKGLGKLKNGVAISPQKTPFDSIVNVKPIM